MYGSMTEELLKPLQGPHQSRQPKARWTRLTVTIMVALGIFLALVAFQKSAQTSLEQPIEEGKVGNWLAYEPLEEDGIPKDTITEDSLSEDKKPAKPWYELDNWGTSAECKEPKLKGEPTLKKKDRYTDEGWVCGKENVAVACDSKTGMDIEMAYIITKEVHQHVFTGGIRLDDAKQLNSVSRSKRITARCNTADLLKDKNNRCDLVENDFVTGEDNSKPESKNRRYKIHYYCIYGKRSQVSDDYKPIVAPRPALTTSAPQGTTEESKQGTTEESKQGTTEESKQGTTEASKQGTTEESKKGTTEASKQGTTEEPKKGTTQGPKQETTEAKSAAQTTENASETTQESKSETTQVTQESNSSEPPKQQTTEEPKKETTEAKAATSAPPQGTTEEPKQGTTQETSTQAAQTTEDGHEKAKKESQATQESNTTESPKQDTTKASKQESQQTSGQAAETTKDAGETTEDY